MLCLSLDGAVIFLMSNMDTEPVFLSFRQTLTQIQTQKQTQT